MVFNVFLGVTVAGSALGQLKQVSIVQVGLHNFAWFSFSRYIVVASGEKVTNRWKVCPRCIS
jgi:hypothetical protein